MNENILMTAMNDLALAYQILAHLKMDDSTYTHLSARSNKEQYYHIYPFGLFFEEVTEKNLLTVSLKGEIIKGEEYQYNQTGYIIHGNIYQNRPEINAVFHLHTPATVAVSALKEGLLPISQWALHFYQKIAYHEYDSLALDYDIQGGKLVRDLGDKRVMLMRNHGMIACGETIHEALFYAYHLELACKTQLMILASNQEFIMPSHEICEKAVRDLLSFEKDLGKRDWNAWVRKISRNKGAVNA